MKIGVHGNRRRTTSVRYGPTRVIHPMPINLRTPQASEYHAEAEVDLPPITVDQLQNVRANAQGQLFRGVRLLPQSFGRPLDRIRYTRPRAWAKFVLRSYLLCRSRRVHESVWVVDNLSPGYFHWLTECLPRLMVAVELDAFPPVVLLPGSFDNPFVTETLEAFPEFTADYVGRWEVVSIQRALVPNRVAPTSYYRPELVRRVAERLASHLRAHEPAGKGPERVYISRGRDARRRIANETEVTRLLAARGFVTVYPGELSVRQQMWYARGARYLVGMHGGGLTNMMFMEPGSSVLELRQQTGLWQIPCYFTLAGVCGLHYYYELCSGANSLDGTDFATFHYADQVVDLTTFSHTLDRMLSRT